MRGFSFVFDPSAEIVVGPPPGMNLRGPKRGP